MTVTTSYTLVSVLLVSMVSLVGVFLLSVQTPLLRRALLLLVSFSTGALLGNVFLHMLPEIVEHAGEVAPALSIVLAGILGSFAIEKFIHWRHCHDVHCETHVHPVGPLILIGDAVHNIVDGVLIATAYLADLQLGIATTVAVVLHEIPQELSDFAVLIHSGFSRGRALLFNFVSALTAIVGASFVLVLSSGVSDVEHILLPLAAGNFLYIAGSDLIPELHKEVRPGKALLQLLCMVAGIAIMFLFTVAPQSPH